jgi:hypothetical protein
MELTDILERRGMVRSSLPDPIPRKSRKVFPGPELPSTERGGERRERRLVDAVHRRDDRLAAGGRC